MDENDSGEWSLAFRFEEDSGETDVAIGKGDFLRFAIEFQDHSGRKLLGENTNFREEHRSCENNRLAKEPFSVHVVILCSVVYTFDLFRGTQAWKFCSVESGGITRICEEMRGRYGR